MTTPRRKLLPMPSSRPFSRYAVDGCRRCSGSGRASRSRRAGRCRAGRSRRTRRSRSRCGGTSPPRSTSREVAHLEQLETLLSDPSRNPIRRELATAFLGLVPSGVDPQAPEDTRWHPLDELPELAYDHEEILLSARERLRGKALVHESRLRARVAELHARRAARSLRGGARPSGERDEPAAGPAAAPAARGHRGAAALRRRRRTPGGDLPLPHEPAGDNRPVRRPSAAYNGSLSSAPPANVIRISDGCKASRRLASLGGRLRQAFAGRGVLGRPDSFGYRGSLRPCLARFSLAGDAATFTGEALVAVRAQTLSRSRGGSTSARGLLSCWASRPPSSSRSPSS